MRVLPKRLRLGINGYYLKQITDTEVDGNDVSNRKEEGVRHRPGSGPIIFLRTTIFSLTPISKQRQRTGRKAFG